MGENTTWIDEVPDKYVWEMYHNERNWCMCHNIMCDNDIELAYLCDFGWRYYCKEHGEEE